MPVNQRDLARILNLSQAAVSRALRNDHRISRGTRERVLAKAQELRYKTDIFSASLSSKAHSRAVEFQGCPVVALIQPTVRQRALVRGSFLESAERFCTARGFVLRQHIIGPNERPAVLARRFRDQGVQGVLIASARGDTSWFTEFPTDDLCVVNIAGRLLQLPYPSVRADVFGVMGDYYRQAWSKGYRRIGAALYRHDPYHPDDDLLRGSFLTEQRKRTGKGEDALLLDLPPSSMENAQSRRLRFLHWIREQRPDAVFLFSPGELDWLMELPDQGGVRGIVMQQPPPRDRPDAGRFAHIHFRWSRVAEIAVQWMETAIRLRQYGPQEAPPHAVVLSDIVSGESFPDLGT